MATHWSNNEYINSHLSCIVKFNLMRMQEKENLKSFFSYVEEFEI